MPNIKRLIFISDSHSKHHQLTNDINTLIDDNTLVIHAGDISNVGKEKEVINFLEWFSKLPCKYKIFIAGNHDYFFEPKDRIDQESIDNLIEKYKDKGVIYLKDEMIEIEGLRVYGSPWQPFFFNWAFNLQRGQPLAEKWALIPENLDLLITHGGPHGMLDYTPQGLYVGCEDLFAKVMEVKPKINVFGHIHFARGIKEFNETLFVNASCLNEQYMYKNKPIVIDFNFDTREYEVINF